MTSPARFLEQHQRETYLRLGLPLPNEVAHLEAISVTNVSRQLLRAQGIKSRRKQRKYAAAERKQYKVDRSECPTAYEIPSMYQRLTALAGEIHETAERNFTDPPQWPLIGTVPMGQLNAMTIPIPGTADYVMLFESSLLIFDLLLTKAVALAIPRDIVEIVTTMANDGADAEEIAMTERAAIVRLIATDPEPSHRFYQLISSYAVRGDMTETEQYMPHISKAKIAELLRDSMRLFVFGHEFGHILAGHFDDAETPVRRLRGSDSDELDYNLDQEKDADVWGVYMASMALKARGQDPVFAAVGADMFFNAIEVLDRAVSTLRYGVPEKPLADSEPARISRRQCLHRLVIRDLYSSTDADRARMLCASNEFIIEMLWAAIEARMLTLRDRGLTAAPQWR